MLDRRILAREILQLLESTPGLKAREIADRLSAEKANVNSIVYGELSPLVVRDESFRWYLYGSPPPPQATLFQSTSPLALPVQKTDFLKRFLQARQLSAADGRPLYAYRCSDAEFVELQSILEDGANDLLRGSSSSLAAPFALYASDWWKRYHEEGTWKWEPIFKSIDLDVQSIGEIYPAVSRGLKFWGRPLLTSAHGRMFLVTLACEGGLPLRLVNKEGARLRRFFRSLLEDFGLYSRAGVPPRDLARRNAEDLPRSWRQEVVFELGGQLVEEIWRLQEEVRHAKDPVAELNRVQPDWRERLPLQVTEDIAVGFLNNLVREARHIREGGSIEFRFVRMLHRSEDGWTLTGNFGTPPLLSSQELAATFNIEESLLPTRGQLTLLNSVGESVTSAFVTEVRREGENCYRIERLRNRNQIMGANVAAAWSLEIESTSVASPPLPIRGGEPLSDDLPWVFGEQDPGLFRFVGQGSVRTRYPKCLVALPDSVEVPSLVKVGTLTELGRNLIEIDRNTDIPSGESSFSICVAQLRDEATEVRINGERFELTTDGREVFQGLPSVLIIEGDGRMRAAKRESLQWRPVRRRDWLPWSEECCGRVAVRLVDQNETKFQRTLEILPRETRVRLLPRTLREGAIEIVTSGGTLITAAQGAGFSYEISQEGRTALLHLRCEKTPPVSVDLSIDFGGARTLTLPIPFPCCGARFVASAERVIRYEECIHVDHLAECRVEAFGYRDSDRFTVDGVLEAQDVPVDVSLRTWREVPRGRAGRHSLELRTLVTPIRELLAHTGALDAHVSLRIEGPDVGPQKIFVKRYDRRFEEKDDGIVIRPDDDRNDPIESDDYVVEAVRLWDPGSGRDTLQRGPDGSGWVWETRGRERGPWLLIGWQGSIPRVRPFLAMSDEENGSLKSSLQQAISKPPDEAKEALQSEVERLIRTPLDPDWDIVTATFRFATDVAPTSLLLTKAIASSSRAAVLSLIHSSNDDRAILWDIMENLPFEWFLTPVDAWEDGAKLYFDALSRVVSDDGSSIAKEQILSLIGFLGASPERQLISPLIDFLDWRILGQLSDSLRFAVSESGGRILLKDLTAVRQGFLSRTATDNMIWPGGENLQRRFARPGEGIVGKLVAKPGSVAGHKLVVLAAPVLAAETAALCASISQDELFEFRQARRFDQEWFDRAYEISLRLILAERLSKNLVLV